MPHMIENKMSGEIHTGDPASTQRNFAPDDLRACSRVPVRVIPTDEELMIAQHTQTLTRKAPVFRQWA